MYNGTTWGIMNFDDASGVTSASETAPTSSFSMQMEMEMLQILKLHISGTMFLDIHRNLAPLKEMEMQMVPL